MAKIDQNKNGTVIQMDSKKPFRILQLTDVHIGAGCLSHRKDKLALDAVSKIVRASKADFVVVTGDIAYPIPIFSGSRNNLKASKMFADKMSELGVAWTLVFGNHDAESFATHSKQEIADFYRKVPNCFFEDGEKDIHGIGNYAIKLVDSKGDLVKMLMFLDSNGYLTWNFFSGFDVIYDNQIDWYKRTIEANKNDKGEVPKSLAFFHIPPKQFSEGWEKCYRGSDEAKYHHGFVGEKDNYFGHPKTKESHFFDEMAALQSCEGMFMGHDHLSCLSLTYKGIRMTYGMSIDYLAYRKIEERTTQRGGTLIDIREDGSFDVSMLPLSDIEL